MMMHRWRHTPTAGLYLKVTLQWRSHVTHMNSWVMSHIWIHKSTMTPDTDYRIVFKRSPAMTEPCHICERKCHVTHTNTCVYDDADNWIVFKKRFCMHNTHSLSLSEHTIYESIIHHTYEYLGQHRHINTYTCTTHIPLKRFKGMCVVHVYV